MDTNELLYRGHLARANGLMGQIEAEGRPATPAEKAEVDRLTGEAFAIAKAADYTGLHDTCWHEAAHAVAFAAEGVAVESVYVKFREARPGFAGGATVAPAGSPPLSAVASIAGQVAARYFGENWPTYNGRNDADNKAIRAATAGRRDLRERAVREAHELLAIHARPLRAVRDRLMTDGAIGAAEIQTLLAPVTAWAARRRAA